MAYTFDDIKDAVTMLADLYAELYLEQPEPPASEEPYHASELLKALGRLRDPLNEYDRQRFDRVLEELVGRRIKQASQPAQSD